MKTSRADKIRVFLVNWLYTSFYGMPLEEWIRMLRKHGFAVDAPYLPRAALMTLTSALTSLIRAYENRKFGPKLADVQIRRPSVHPGALAEWHDVSTQSARPGRTIRLPQHVAGTQPAHLSLHRAVLGDHQLAAPKTRLIDNVAFASHVPLEDEFATFGTMSSPFLGWIFPRWADYYDRYLTFRAIPEDEVDRWKASLVLLYKKLTWKFGRPLLLKSPPHTGRIALLLKMFPDARFVHIHRDPFAVFRSTRRRSPVMRDGIVSKSRTRRRRSIPGLSGATRSCTTPSSKRGISSPMAGSTRSASRTSKETRLLS